MTSQQLADELARIAGWVKDTTVPRLWTRPFNGNPADLEERRSHPFKIGSIDALEAFRRERLPGWWFYDIGRLIGRNDYEATMVHETTTHDSWGFVGPLAGGQGPDEWSARASALIAASKENKQ